MSCHLRCRIKDWMWTKSKAHKLTTCKIQKNSPETSRVERANHIQRWSAPFGIAAPSPVHHDEEKHDTNTVHYFLHRRRAVYSIFLILNNKANRAAKITGLGVHLLSGWVCWSYVTRRREYGVRWFVELVEGVRTISVQGRSPTLILLFNTLSIVLSSQSTLFFTLFPIEISLNCLFLAIYWRHF